VFEYYAILINTDNVHLILEEAVPEFFRVGDRLGAREEHHSFPKV